MTINCCRRPLTSPSRASTTTPASACSCPARLARSSLSDLAASACARRAARPRSRGSRSARPRRSRTGSRSARTASSPSSRARSTRSRATTRSSSASTAQDPNTKIVGPRHRRRALRDGDRKQPSRVRALRQRRAGPHARATASGRRIYRRGSALTPAPRPRRARGTATDMTLDDLDTILAELRAASERIGANLLELELDPSRELLEGVALEGESAARWSQASAALLELWRRTSCWATCSSAQWRCAAGADGCPPNGWPSSTRAAARALDRPLHGPVPIGERALLGTSRGADRCTPRELLSRMGVAFAEVSATLAALTAPWDELAPRLAAAGDALREATELSPAPSPTRWPPRRAAAPSSAHGSRGTRSRWRPTRWRRSKRRWRRSPVRPSPSPSCATGADEAPHAGACAARAAEQAREEALSAREAALAKIARPRRGRPPDGAAAGGWARADRAPRPRPAAGARPRRAGPLDGARDRRARAGARGRATANRAPIEARDELRGRLDAYRAKARSLRAARGPQRSSSSSRRERTGRCTRRRRTSREADAARRRYQQARSPTATSEVLR